jgi:gamma-glutamylputrescine oxidase
MKEGEISGSSCSLQVVWCAAVGLTHYTPKRKSMQFSYWERRTFLDHADILVVGSGIVGLSTAIHLKRSSPGLRILVVEAHPVSGGASSRNAGFACFGSAGELLDDSRTSGLDAVIALAVRRYHGLRALRELLSDEAIGYEPCGGVELFRHEESDWMKDCLDALPELNERLKPELGDVPYELTGEFNSNAFCGAIRNRMEGAVDTGMLIDALQDLSDSLSIRRLHGVQVGEWEMNPKGVRVTLNGEWIQAGKMVVCTNGFARQLLPEIDVQPARNQVLVTSVIPGLKWTGTFHLDKGYGYFRDVHGRLLIGGFRNADLQHEFTSQHGSTAPVQSALRHALNELILQGIPYTIDYSWSGIMGLGPAKEPVVKQVMPGVYCGVRMGGMGVAIGTLIGRELAELVLRD